jgi:hypothetical protein
MSALQAASSDEASSVIPTTPLSGKRALSSPRLTSLDDDTRVASEPNIALSPMLPLPPLKEGSERKRGLEDGALGQFSSPCISNSTQVLLESPSVPYKTRRLSGRGAAASKRVSTLPPTLRWRSASLYLWLSQGASNSTDRTPVPMPSKKAAAKKKRKPMRKDKPGRFVRVF